MDEAARSGPVWRVPRHPLPVALRRVAAQPLAITDLVMPNGKRYRVQISPQRPEQSDPLNGVGELGGDLLTDLLPALVGAASSAVIAKARVALTHGGVGWTIEVIRRETRMRAERIVLTETFDDAGAVIDRAYELTEHIQNGRGRLYW